MIFLDSSAVRSNRGLSDSESSRMVASVSMSKPSSAILLTAATGGSRSGDALSGTMPSSSFPGEQSIRISSRDPGSTRLFLWPFTSEVSMGRGDSSFLFTTERRGPNSVAPFFCCSLFSSSLNMLNGARGSGRLVWPKARASGEKTSLAAAPRGGGGGRERLKDEWSPLAGLTPSLVICWQRGELPKPDRWDEEEEDEEEEEEVRLLPGDRKEAKGMFSLFSGSSVSRREALLLPECRRILLGMLVMLERGVSTLVMAANCRSGGLGVAEPLDSLSIDRRR